MNLEKKAKKLAKKIHSHEKILVVSHIDADGMTSASIAKKALERENKEVNVQFFKQLDDDNIKKMRNEEHELVWITDMGSGQLTSLTDINCVITDHHEPECEIDQIKSNDPGNILSYGENNILELNPHRFGLDGAKEISGAGLTYLVAKHMNANNKDLSKLAVVGAVGDLQSAECGKLVGKNRDFIEDAEEEGVIRAQTDTTLYGIQSRPLPKLLEYASNPILPGLSSEEENCINFLIELDVPLKIGDEWRKWYELEREEKRKILSALGDRMLDSGFPPEYVEKLVGEIYTLKGEQEGTMIRQAKEFSTLLNSCGKYEKPNIGMDICLGDRGESYEKAQKLLLGHQKALVDSMELVESMGIQTEEVLQHFHAHGEIPDTIIGTVAGMMLNSGNVDRGLPIFAFTESEDREGIKVSSRGTKQLVDKGLDLSEVMSKCSQEVDGKGGGHDIAAGALIPYEKEEDFLDEVREMVDAQLNGGD